MTPAEEDAASVGWPDAVAGMAYFTADLARWSGDSTTARAELAHAEALLDRTGMDAVFRAMSVPLARVLEGIAAAHEAGLWPVKLNTVV